MEDAVRGSGRISNIDAGNAARDEHSTDFFPNLIEILVHLIVGWG